MPGPQCLPAAVRNLEKSKRTGNKSQKSDSLYAFHLSLVIICFEFSGLTSADRSSGLEFISLFEDRCQRRSRVLSSFLEHKLVKRRTTRKITGPMWGEFVTSI